MTWLGWTDNNTAEAHRLYVSLGWGATKVAEAIGAPSRNAVIGKAYRMGWTAERSPEVARQNSAEGARRARGNGGGVARAVQARLEQERQRDAKIKAAKEALAAGQPPKPWHTPRKPPETIATAPRHWTTRRATECAWPMEGTEGADTLSCCNRKEREGRPYCDAHAAWVYLPTSSPNELARSVRRHVAA